MIGFYVKESLLTPFAKGRDLEGTHCDTLAERHTAKGTIQTEILSGTDLN